MYNNGPVIANFHYQTVNNTANPVVKTKEFGVGGGYTFGDLRLRVGWGKADPDGSSNNLTQVHAGAAYVVGAGEAYIQFQQLKREAASGTAPKANNFGLGYVYNVSKRSQVYAAYGQVRNNATANFSIVNSANAYAPSAVGEDPKALTLGIRHQF